MRCRPVDRSAADRTAGAADHRLLLGSHLDAPRTPPSVLPRRRHPGLDRAAGDAAVRRAVDRRGTAVDARRLDQHLDGTVPRVRRRPARSPRNGAAGYAMQSFFIGFGAVVASVLPDCSPAWASATTAPTPRATPSCPTRCAIRSTSARWCCSARSCGPCCARASIRPKAARVQRCDAEQAEGGTRSSRGSAEQPAKGFVVAIARHGGATTVAAWDSIASCTWSAACRWRWGVAHCSCTPVSRARASSARSCATWTTCR